MNIDGYVFDNIKDLYSKKLFITSATNQENNGIFDIVSFSDAQDTLLISSGLDHIHKNQISVIRLNDNKDIWNDNCSVDYADNKLLIPSADQINNGDKVLIIYYKYNNIKQTPSKVSVVLSDQVANSGTLTMYGNTLVKGKDIVFTATANGLKHSLNEAVRKALGIASNATIPSNARVVKISSLERVSTISSLNNEVLEVLSSYDIKYSKVKNSSYYSNELTYDSSFGNLDIQLPSTPNNTLNTVDNRNLIKIGDKLRITFYVLLENDSETLNYTRNGVLYTNKNFVLIDKVVASSGFKSSQSSTFVSSLLNQPSLGARYRVKYDYTAPKQNERIVVRYTYNKVIGDTTFNIENTRPINADVLVKAARSIPVDMTMNIVIKQEYLSSTTLIVQNLKDKLIDGVNTNILGDTIDASDFINLAYTVEGVDRARITYFNKNGESGQKLSLVAQKNEYFSANNVIVNVETR
jgi:hypothetical protein